MLKIGDEFCLCSKKRNIVCFYTYLLLLLYEERNCFGFPPMEICSKVPLYIRVGHTSNKIRVVERILDKNRYSERATIQASLSDCFLNIIFFQKNILFINFVEIFLKDEVISGEDNLVLLVN